MIIFFIVEDYFYYLYSNYSFANTWLLKVNDFLFNGSD